MGQVFVRWFYRKTFINVWKKEKANNENCLISSTIAIKKKIDAGKTIFRTRIARIKTNLFLLTFGFRYSRSETDGAASAESNMFELCRVATDENEVKLQIYLHFLSPTRTFHFKDIRAIRVIRVQVKRCYSSQQSMSADISGSWLRWKRGFLTPRRFCCL